MVIDTTREVQKIERNDTDRIIAAGAGSEGVNFVRLLLQQPIIQQITEGKRNRKYSYTQYVAILSEGAELS